jgi:hypothetical protein
VFRPNFKVSQNVHKQKKLYRKGVASRVGVRPLFIVEPHAHHTFRLPSSAE